MSDAALPTGYGPQEARHAKAHITYQKREARRDKIVKRGSLALNILLGGALLGHVYADDFYVFPLTRVVPVFVRDLGHGALSWAVTTDQLPPGEHEAVVRSTLWQYIEQREGYSFAGSQYAYDVVTGMTAPGKVRDAYVGWVSQKNPNSYRAKLGADGTIAVDFVDGQFKEQNGQGSYVVQYYRTVSVPGAPQLRQLYSVRVTFTDEFVISAKERATRNPLSVLVTGYSNPLAMAAPK
jgi:type IV secretory pathway component VirB8